MASLELTALLVALIAGPVATWGGIALNRRRNRAEASSLVSQAAATAVETMSAALNRLELEAAEQRVLIRQLSDDNQLLRDKVETLAGNNRRLLLDLEKLTAKLDRHTCPNCGATLA